MTAPTDAYDEWLGIPPNEQPPNHYRLLSLELFESDPEVIAAGAKRQVASVLQHAAGQHAAQSQELLRAISVARMCLLNPQRKSAYDDELRAQSIHGASDEAAGRESIDEDWVPPTAPAMTRRRRPNGVMALVWKLAGFGSSVAISPYLAILILTAFGQRIPESLRFLPGLGGIEQPADEPTKSQSSNTAATDRTPAKPTQASQPNDPDVSAGNQVASVGHVSPSESSPQNGVFAEGGKDGATNSATTSGSNGGHLTTG